jgi:hypothetical protein
LPLPEEPEVAVEAAAVLEEEVEKAPQRKKRQKKWKKKLKLEVCSVLVPVVMFFENVLVVLSLLPFLTFCRWYGYVWGRW